MISKACVAALSVAVSAALIAPLACAAPSNADIAIGGVDGVEALANPDNTAAVRASGRVRLYVHTFVWGRTDPKTRAAIVRVFQNTGPAAVEVAESKSPAEYWDHYFKMFAESGLTSIDQAHVNTLTGTTKFTLTPAQWQAYVDAARSHGVHLVSPMFTPNDRTWDVPFASPQWDDARQRAKYGGGLTIDSPPFAFTTFPPAYQRFVEDEMRWARSEGLQATLILSPPRTATGDFFGAAKKMLAQLAKDDAMPSAYIVENYLSKPPPNYRFVVGSEHDSQSITGVAAWIVNNTPRRPAHP